MNDYESLRRVIPTLITFRRREDRLFVDTNGDGILTWNFELTTDPSRSISELTFPVYVEMPLKQAVDRAIFVEAVEVDGEPQDTTGMPKLIEKRYPEGQPPGEPEMIHYAHVTVPVSLQEGQNACTVYIRLRLWNTFPHVKTVESLFVDIPYVTEQLRVEIASEYPAVKIPLQELQELQERTGTVTAMSSLMQTFDQYESRLQSRLCEEIKGRLVWMTNSAKLGYHYKLYFRLSEF